MVDSLISAYDLHSRCCVVSVTSATMKELTAYHARPYVEELLKERDDYSEDDADDIKALRSVFSSRPERISEAKAPSGFDVYGLEHDCPTFPFMNEYIKFIAGSSLSAANCLITGTTLNKVAINWYGGRHHCLKNRASGFCYVNDIVLAILRLRSKFKRVAYVDLDLHHGDGVEKAFQYSRNVTTCSVHMYDVGFYPGTGSTDSSQVGKYNIALKRGLTDAKFVQVIEQFVCPLLRALDPEVFVVQLGCDGLASDPLAQWNLTMEGYWHGSETLLKSFPDTPFLFLGGGGYNSTETAKCWAYVTKMIVGDVLEWSEIPDHDLLENYADDSFQFWTGRNQAPMVGRKDENSSQYLKSIHRILEKFW